ncbi:hypothetical protein [Thalassotalea crassostreae]|uniref:hypothetical protein n=1 Tax=Thalassotalea crassostreae TaxID=1763536 RepID=UPI0008382F28|nr:hypothetical protein [Thalassotalea crassostreae]
MDIHKLSFAQVTVLSNRIVKIAVDQGANVDLEMIDEIKQLFCELFDVSFSILVNKSNSYSTQLEALVAFGKIENIDKIAILAPNKMAHLSADFSANIPSSAALNIKIFNLRNEALAWIN